MRCGGSEPYNVRHCCLSSLIEADFNLASFGEIVFADLVNL
jgi:hypothetical protein